MREDSKSRDVDAVPKTQKGCHHRSPLRASGRRFPATARATSRQAPRVFDYRFRGIASHDARETAALKSVHQRNDLNEQPKPGVDPDSEDRREHHFENKKDKANVGVGNLGGCRR